MPLKLRVISDHYKALGPRRSQLFGVTGGSIGRSPDNDWILPDTNRFISGRHATVSFNAGTWFLNDTSRNGVYLNNSEVPISETGPAKLEDGDRLRFGEYDVLVSIDEHNDFSPDATGQMPTPPALLDRSSEASKESRKKDKHGSFRSEPVKSTLQLDSLLQPDLDVTDLLVPANRKDAKKDRLSNSASIKLHVDGFSNVSQVFADFCRGLGVDPSALPTRTESAVLTAAGQLIRETIIQLTRTLRVQSDRANELEVDTAGTDIEHGNPLQTSPNYAATVYRLFDSISDRKMNGIEALQDAFHRVRDHQDAFDAAIAPAVAELLSRVDPARLSAVFDRSSSGASPFSGGKKAKFWDQYGEVFTAIDQRDARGWPTIFTREFAKSMAAQLRDQRKRQQ